MSEIIDLKIDQIKPNDWNPNEMTPAEFAEMVAELTHLGKPAKPIVLRKNGSGYEIIDGEHSYRALKELGHKTLQPGWYEIEKYDDFEAMRQTYKRNQHGTHNPVKQGQLFKRMMQGRDLSQRALAEEIGVSEGTVRNSLEYAQAAEVRNDYAFGKLSVKQVRAYNRLPKIAGDLWLSCGADFDAFTPSHIEKNLQKAWGPYESYDEMLMSVKEDWPTHAWLKPYLSILPNLCYTRNAKGFRYAFESILNLDRARTIVKGAKPIPLEMAFPYIEEFSKIRWEGDGSPDSNLIQASYLLRDLFRHDGKEYKPVVSIEAFRAWLDDPDDEWKNISELCAGIRALVVLESGEETMMQSVRDQVMAKELEMAPDYIKAANMIPLGELYAVYKLESEAPQEIVEQAKRETIETLKKKHQAQKNIDEMRKLGDYTAMMGAIKAEAQWTGYTPAKVFEDSLIKLARGQREKELIEFHLDKNRVVNELVTRASEHLIMRERSTIDGKPATDVFRERLQAIPDLDFLYLVALIINNEARSEVQKQWLENIGAVPANYLLKRWHKCPTKEIYCLEDEKRYCSYCGLSVDEMTTRLEIDER